MVNPNCQYAVSTSGGTYAGIMGQVWPSLYQPPKSHISVNRADTMTVKQTAEWIRTLGRSKQWKEADKYADNFDQNDISGSLLRKLTKKALQEDLGILKHEHRLMIMLAIKNLFSFPALPRHLAEKNMKEKHDNQSTMSESALEAGSVGETSSSSRDKSPSMSSMIVNLRDLEKHQLEVEKWTGNRTKSSRTGNSFSRKAQPVNSRSKGQKARPKNPMVYRTSRKIKLRSQKYGFEKDIGSVPSRVSE